MSRPAPGVDPRFKGFAPVLDSGVRVLVLGSFPSSASLAARQYYGHPRNQFWRILGDILGEPLASLPYADRLERVLARVRELPAQRQPGLSDSCAPIERLGAAAAPRARVAGSGVQRPGGRPFPGADRRAGLRVCGTAVNQPGTRGPSLRSETGPLAGLFADLV